ncbi:MAG: glycosyltransferase [Candidatus Babeliales bacterium]|nr:glycosyltransferase [Candidatus Babeliales bacterium]
MDIKSEKNLSFTPKVSIITSIYKGEIFIEHFLQEITKQTIFNQCELILINANSPENEEKIIKPYLKKYKNIIYKKLKKRVTIYSAWNEAIRLASGRYLTNANVDDRLEYTCYETYVKTLDKYKSVDLVYSDGYQTNIINTAFAPNPRIGTISKPEFSKMYLRYNCLPSFNPMWRKKLHNKFGLFNENFTIVGDWEFWIRIARNDVKFKKVPGFYGLAYHNPMGLSTNGQTMDLLAKEKLLVRTMHKDFFY